MIINQCLIQVVPSLVTQLVHPDSQDLERGVLAKSTAESHNVTSCDVSLLQTQYLQIPCCVEDLSQSVSPVPTHCVEV